MKSIIKLLLSVAILAVVMQIGGCSRPQNNSTDCDAVAEIPDYDREMFPDSAILENFDSLLCIMMDMDHEVYGSNVPIKSIEALLQTTVIPLIESDTACILCKAAIMELENTRYLTLTTDFGRDTLNIPVDQLMAVPDSLKSAKRFDRHIVDVLPLPCDLVLVRLMFERYPGMKACGRDFFLFLKKTETGYELDGRTIMATY